MLKLLKVVIHRVNRLKNTTMKYVQFNLNLSYIVFTTVLHHLKGINFHERFALLWNNDGKDKRFTFPLLNSKSFWSIFLWKKITCAMEQEICIWSRFQDQEKKISHKDLHGHIIINGNSEPRETQVPLFIVPSLVKWF